MAFEFSRRELMRISMASAFGVSFSQWLPRLARAAAAEQTGRSCILLWMGGGPSQTDTFDLKPDHKNGGEFKEIETAEMGGASYQMYVIKILDNGLTYKVPVNNTGANGIREVIPIEAVDKVYEVLRDRDTPADKQTWNRRYREYMNKIKTGDPLEVAKVLRDLALMKLEKSLSFGEKKMYDQARTLLVQELSVAKTTNETAIEQELEDLFEEDRKIAEAEAARAKANKKKKK